MRRVKVTYEREGQLHTMLTDPIPEDCTDEYALNAMHRATSMANDIMEVLNRPMGHILHVEVLREGELH